MHEESHGMNLFHLYVPFFNVYVQDTIYSKILAREARAAISSKDLFEMIRSDFMDQVHKARPLPQMTEIEFGKQLLLIDSRKDNGLVADDEE